MQPRIDEAQRIKRALTVEDKARALAASQGDRILGEHHERIATHPLVVFAIEQVDRISPILVVRDGENLTRVIKCSDRLRTSIEHALRLENDQAEVNPSLYLEASRAQLPPAKLRTNETLFLLNVPQAD